MKIRKLMPRRARTKPTPLFFYDEFHSIGGTTGVLSEMFHASRSKGTGLIIVTQAVIKKNSGKRTVFIGQSRFERTGESVVKTPKKFVPAQVERRLAA